MTIKITLTDVDLSFKYRDLQAFRSDLRASPGGVYAFYNTDGECLYVGKSKTLYKRLGQHRSSVFFAEIERVDVRYVGNPSDRDIYETYAIRVFNPAYNRDKVYIKATSPRLVSKLEELAFDLDHVSTLKQDALANIAFLESLLVPPGRRRNPNFDKDDSSLSDAFCDYIEELADFDSDDLSDTRQELVEAEELLKDLLAEERSLRDQIERTYTDMVV